MRSRAELDAPTTTPARRPRLAPFWTQTGRVRAKEDGSPSESAVKAVTGLRRTGALLSQLYKAVTGLRRAGAPLNQLSRQSPQHRRASSAVQGAGPAWPRGCGPLAFSVTPEALLLALCPGAQILSQIQEGTQWHIIFLMMLGNR